MKYEWLAVLKQNPISALLLQPDEALRYFINRDLLGEPVSSITTLWELPGANLLVRKQQDDGSWKYPGVNSGSVPGQNYSLLEIFRNLRILVEVYGFTRAHFTIQKAAEFVFSCQTGEGDIRGILGNQYMPYYHGAILELLVKAGYGDDPRLMYGLDWLLSMRQEDGGWIVPTQLVPWKKRTPEFWQSDPVHLDRSKPHAHMATGMVLRPFAEHPDYRSKPEVITAGEALKVRILKPDKYNDRKARSYWLKFQFPFWWSSLVTTMDTLAKLGFERQDADISRGLDWFFTYQEEDGLWPTGYGSGKKAGENRRWVGLAICRSLKVFYQGTPA
jgi:hypothetical protein